MSDLEVENAVVLPADKPKPRKGERAAKIRQLHTDYPELSQSAIARKVGCHPDNVYQVLRRFSGRDNPAHLEGFRAHKVDIFEMVQSRMLASITDEKLAKESAYSAVVAASIIQDKIQLMSGLPTSIHVTALLDIADQLRKREDQR
jgi:hypothetical protein